MLPAGSCAASYCSAGLPAAPHPAHPTHPPHHTLILLSALLCSAPRLNCRRGVHIKRLRWRLQCGRLICGRVHAKFNFNSFYWIYF